MPNKLFRSPTQGALFAVEKGCSVFPVKPNGKAPRLTGWQEWADQATVHKVEQYGVANAFTNWGVYCKDLIVIDLDNKKGKSGVANFKKLLSEQGQAIPETLRVRTPSGGYHLYFHGKARNSVGLLSEGIDVRGEGGYVVAPGSIIEEKQYEVDRDRDIAVVPEWLLTLLKGLTKKEPLDAEEITQVLEGSRDDTITRIGGALRRHGLGYDAILAAITVENHRICQPPLPLADLERIAASVAKYAPETIKAVEDFTVIEDSEMKAVKYSDFKGIPPKRSWIIKDWLPMKEISSIYGPGGAGKSLLALQLELAVATGASFLGLDIETPMPVLGIHCEDSRDELHRRQYAIQNAPEADFMDVEPSDIPLYLWPRVGMQNDLARISEKGNDVVEGPFRPVVEAQLKVMPKGPKLLVLDTLSDIYLGDENIRERVNKFIKSHVGSLVQDYDLTVLLLAHPSRTGKNTGDMLSGSTAWENSVRNRLAMMPHKEFPDITIVKRMKANYAHSGEELTIQWDQGRFILADVAAVAEHALSEESKAVLSALVGHLAELDRLPINRAARLCLRDPELSHLFANKALSTVERSLTKTFQYPRKADGFIYFYEERPITGEKATRWICKEPADEDTHAPTPIELSDMLE